MIEDLSIHIKPKHMYLRPFFYASVILIMFHASCAKDNTTNTTQGSLIKTLFRDASPLYTSSRSYSYNSKNQLTRIDYASSQYTEFEYTGNKIVEITNIVFAQISDTSYYFLNSQNLVDSSVTADGLASYHYNSDGYLISKTNYDLNGDSLSVQYSTIQNGNVIKNETIWWDGTLVESVTYSDFDANNKNTLSYANLGQSYFGKSSVNPPKKTVVFDGSSETIFDDVFSFDASGRITKLEHHIDPDPEYIDTYTYY